SENKIAVNTYHVCKGRERKLVIMLNFDQSYFTWFAKNDSDHTCANPQYVAATRSSVTTVFVQNHKEEHLSYLDWDKVQETCQVVDISKGSRQKRPKHDGKNNILPVTVLLDYLTFDVLH